MKLSKGALALAVTLLFSVATTRIPVSADEESGVTSDSIFFGTSFAQTGPASLGARSYYSGISAYFSFVNDNGGIYGRKLNFLKEDDRGIVSQSISNSNKLVSGNNVFALISNAPDCASQIAVSSSLGLGRKRVPNLFVDCYLESVSRTDDREQPDTSTNFYKSISRVNQFKILKHYLDNNLPSQRFILVYQSDDSKLAIEQLIGDPKLLCESSFLVGASVGIGCNSSSTPLQNGDVVVFSGGAVGLINVIANFLRTPNRLSLRYFVNEEAFNPTAFTLAGLPRSAWPEIYSVSSNRLLTETSNPAVATLTSIAQRYAGDESVDQRFLNGVNAGYIISNVLASVGKNLTRERFLRAIDAYGSNFDVLGLSVRSKDPSMRFIPMGGVIVKHGASGDQAISEVLSVDQGRVVVGSRNNIQITSGGLPALVQRLPNDPPSATPSPMSTPAKPSPTPTSRSNADTGAKPPTTSSQVLELDGEEEDPFGKIEVRRDRNRFVIQISSNLQNEDVQVRATKKGQRAIIFRVTTDDDGAVRFATNRALSGFSLALLFDGQVIGSARVS